MGQKVEKKIIIIIINIIINVFEINWSVNKI